MSHRALTTGVGAALITAAVFGAATSSAHAGDRMPTLTAAAPAPELDVLPASATALSNFAPPAELPESKIAPQFRLAADLPSGPLGIPGIVLQAYKLAAGRLADEQPGCKLPWYLLAGIGHIESNHAGNGNVDAYGNSLSPIMGPALDGTLPGNEVIHDAAGQAVRAVGPMQFLPSTWAKWGADANGDGKADPNNVFDATYSAGRYLCSGVTDIMAGDHPVAAVLRYNHSMAYVTNVLGWAAAYATGVMPTNPPKDPRRAAASTTTTSSTPATPGPSSTETPTPPAQKQNCVIICLPNPFAPPAKPSPSAPKPTDAPPAPDSKPAPGKADKPAPRTPAPAPNPLAPLIPTPR